MKHGAVLKKVLGHMPAAARGLRRLESALEKVGPEELAPHIAILRVHFNGANRGRDDAQEHSPRKPERHCLRTGDGRDIQCGGHLSQRRKREHLHFECACKECHAALADHPIEVWAKREWNQRAIFCGACGTESTIQQYLQRGSQCTVCGVLQPTVQKHYHYYFAH